MNILEQLIFITDCALIDADGMNLHLFQVRPPLHVLRLFPRHRKSNFFLVASFKVVLSTLLHNQLGHVNSHYRMSYEMNHLRFSIFRVFDFSRRFEAYIIHETMRQVQLLLNDLECSAREAQDINPAGCFLRKYGRLLIHERSEFEHVKGIGRSGARTKGSLCDIQYSYRAALCLALFYPSFAFLLFFLGF